MARGPKSAGRTRSHAASKVLSPFRGGVVKARGALRRRAHRL